jgi:hypothetical protein
MSWFKMLTEYMSMLLMGVAGILLRFYQGYLVMGL